MASLPADSAPFRGVTRQLCGFLARTRFSDLSARAVAEARRGILDWLGCALAGSGHPVVDKLTAVFRHTGGSGAATVWARGLRLGLLETPMVNGQMGHVLDFDDTHAGGVLLHVSTPVLAALFALAERGTPVSGRDFIVAYAAGFEAGVRTGRAAPSHHAGGWHLTGTLGTIAAGAAAGRLLGLDEQRLTYALGIAATQAGGMQQNRGTMCKSFHAGKAAAGGVLAALLAAEGYDSATDILEGAKGFTRIYSQDADLARLTDNLGRPWLIETNGHKPYACGLVLHALIDGVLALRGKVALPAEAIDEITVTVHPLAVAITGVTEPASGLKAKFSIVHTAAVAYIDGAAGTAQYTDAKARDPHIIALRRKVKVIADAALHNDEARVSLRAGTVVEEVHIVHASGTVANPMSDAALEAKFRANAVPVIGESRAQQVCEAVAQLTETQDMRSLIALLA